MKRLTIIALAVASLAITPLGSARANATTIQVRGGEFFFKLSTRTIARPGSQRTPSHCGVALNQ